MAEPSLQKPLLSPEQGLRRTIILSLVLHLLVLALFAGDFLPRRKLDERPVYVVDLLNLPVKDPQAGRPDAAKEPPKTPDKAPEPPAAAPPEKAPEPVKLPPKTPEPPKPEPVKPVKPTPKPEVVKPAPTKEPPPKPAPAKEAAMDSVTARIEALRREQERNELKEKLAALGSKDSRGRGTDAPLGMPDGKGKEVGVEQQLWLKEFLKQAWALSKYQVSRRDLEALVVLEFDPSGRLINYRFSKKSGDDRFDDSVRKAVLKLNEITLPIPPGKRVEQEAKFNLADLTD